MTHTLDTPVWSTLTSDHANFRLGNDMALRFDPEVAMFAATRDDTQASLTAFGTLLRQTREQAFMMQDRPICLPDDVQPVLRAAGLQLVQTRAAQVPKAMPDWIDKITLLDPEDLEDMLALTALTKPGPFMRRTPELGRFWGVRIDGRLAAMAGQRLAMPGFREVSGVCTHPDFRGKGLAAVLSCFVAERIAEEGRTPFLHAYSDNAGALKLYHTLGFTTRIEVHVAVVKPLN
ncbi:MAG: GNAT family N-acetyltransferase [Rhodobacteraceae bacterium]|nr:GNAT family N-acetyltransferase [Paracoccaceae bacterium]